MSFIAPIKLITKPRNLTISLPETPANSPLNMPLQAPEISPINKPKLSINLGCSLQLPPALEEKFHTGEIHTGEIHTGELIVFMEQLKMSPRVPIPFCFSPTGKQTWTKRENIYSPKNKVEFDKTEQNLAPAIIFTQSRAKLQSNINNAQTRLRSVSLETHLPSFIRTGKSADF